MVSSGQTAARRACQREHQFESGLAHTARQLRLDAAIVRTWTFRSHGEAEAKAR